MLLIGLGVVILLLLLSSYLSNLIVRAEITGKKGSRSVCDNCDYQLDFLDLIPIFSYIFRRGKCPDCNKSIDVRYLLSELYSVLFGFLLALFIASDFMFEYKILILIAALILYVLAHWDIWTYSIPRNITYLFYIIGLLVFVYVNINSIFFAPHSSSLNSLVSFVITFLILYSIKIITKDKGLGLGDIIIVSIISLIFGTTMMISFFYITVFSSLFFAIILYVFTKKLRGVIIPMIPFISIGFVLSLLIGIDIYQYFFII